MKIAVLSDIHDNIWNLKKVLMKVRKEKCKAIVFCGDYCAPGAMKLVASLKLPTHAVFGNVDGAHYEITKWLFKNMPHYEQYKHLADFELGGRKIAVTHYPEFAYGLAHIGKYDVVFYGHTHQAEQKTINKTLLANPGEIQGQTKCTFGIYETKSGELEIIEI